MAYLYKKHGSWHCRFNENGTRRSVRLASCADFPRERDIQPLFHKFMAEHAQSNRSTQPLREYRNKPLREFVTTEFFPWAERTKKPSTLKGYKQIWSAYLDASLGSIVLSRVSRSDVLRLLERLQIERYAFNLVQNTKIVLSAIFARALTLELVESNPAHQLKLHQTAAQDGARYTITEIERVLPLCSLRDRALLATMFYAALRPGEAAALAWEDYDGKGFNIHQAVWNGNLGTPKTLNSVAYVPAVEPLRQILAEYKPTTADLSWMFPGATGNPIRLSALAHRVMIPAFKRAGVKWRGFYALRRGATDYLLVDSGLSLDDARTILRHDPRSKVLEKHYAARVAQQNVQKRAALAIGKKIDAAFAQREAEQIASAQSSVVN